PSILGWVRPASASAGQRPCLDTLPLDLHQLLGRGAHDVPVPAQREEEHVGRGVDRAQAAIDVKRARRQPLVESLRDDDLEGVAREYVLARRIDHGLELPWSDVRFPWRPVDSATWFLVVARREALLHLLDPADLRVILLVI